jgi:hypothetical protein
MRRLIVVLAAGIVVISVVAIADFRASTLTSVRVGSVAFDPEASGLALLPPEDGCGASAATCSRRYAFAPNRTLTTWVSVRNDGPLPVTLVGASRWLDGFGEQAMLAEPISVTDGGNPLSEAQRAQAGAPFDPVVLETEEQRLVIVEFRTTSDFRDACERWMAGSGVVFESIPVEWHWLVRTQTQDIAFAEPIEFMAPTSADCTT